MAYGPNGKWFKLALREMPKSLSPDGMGGSVDVWSTDQNHRGSCSPGSPYKREVIIGDALVQITVRVLVPRIK